MQNILEILTRIGPGRLIAIGVTLAGLVGFFGFFIDKMTKPEMTVLFSDLEPADAGAVMSRLETMGVPAEPDASGTAVLAPKDEIARLRMILAQDGLPSGGSAGYELLDNSDGLGTTSFAQQMTRLRALEGELARSIRTLGPVKQARVHLVLPKRELFSRDQQEPSASIVVAVRGAALNPGQVASIRHLVASAVPKLRSDRISIVDTAGNLLASGESIADSPDGGASDAAQERKVEIERRLSDAIESLLERAVGPGRVRAEVSADLDFDRITTNSEEFDPAGQVLRSNQIVTEESESQDKSGDGRVSVDRNLPEADLANGADGGGSAAKSARTEEISNFEISKTIRTHIRESGLIRRLSVAVIVDAEAKTDAEGNTVFEPRPAEQLTKLEQLAKSAVGFDAARGDVFEIASLEFVRPDAFFGDADPDAIKLTKEDYFRIGQLAALFVVALLAMLLVMRPAVTRIFAKPEPEPTEEELAALEGPDGAPAALMGPDGQPLPVGQEEEEEDRIQLDSIRGSVSTSTVTKVGALIDEFPEETLSVVRGWMQGDQ